MTHCPTCGTESNEPFCGSCGTELTAPASSAQAPVDFLPPGTTIGGGRFVLHETLGQGGFGVTYRAFDTRLDRHVAVKEFFPAGCIRVGETIRPSTVLAKSFDDVRARFVGEATTLAQLRHPGIVPVFEVLSELGTAFIVMEFVHGQTLDAIVSEQGPQPADRVATILREVGSALSYIHARNVLHRDVSPSNLIDSEGRIVLIDFGAAREFLADQSSDLSQIVKPGFSPLEQYSGRGTIGPPSDIYALSATAYFLLTGHKPMDATARIQGIDLEPIATLAPSTPASVIHAIERGLEIAPAQRPQSVDELLALLDSEAPTRTANSSAASERTQQLSGGDQTMLQRGPSPAMTGPGTAAKRNRTPIYVAIGLAMAAIIAVVALLAGGGSGTPSAQPTVDSTIAGTPATPPAPTPTNKSAPDVVGASEQSAISTAEGQGIRVIVEHSTSSSVAAGFVVRQLPAAGTPTDTITITVSDGAPPAPEDTSAPRSESGPPPSGSGGGAEEESLPRSGPITGVVDGTNGTDGVTNKTGEGFLAKRAGKTSKSTELGRIYEGDSLQFVCQAHGKMATSAANGNSDVWAQLVDGSWVAMVYVQANGYSRYSVTIPC